jgi:hypothetical protein
MRQSTPVTHHRWIRVLLISAMQEQEQEQEEGATVLQEHLLRCHFIPKMYHCTKTGSIQTQGKQHSKQGGDHGAAGARCWEWMDDAGKKTPLFAPFIYKSHLFTKTGSGQT